VLDSEAKLLTELLTDGPSEDVIHRILHYAAKREAPVQRHFPASTRTTRDCPNTTHNPKVAGSYPTWPPTKARVRLRSFGSDALPGPAGCGHVRTHPAEVPLDALPDTAATCPMTKRVGQLGCRLSAESCDPLDGQADGQAGKQRWTSAMTHTVSPFSQLCKLHGSGQGRSWICDLCIRDCRSPRSRVGSPPTCLVRRLAI